jgi:hypothetical protein
MENNDGPNVVTPQMKTKKGRPKMLSGWQDAYEFTQQPFDRNKLETSSRLRKTSDRKASLQHKKKIAALDAPNLSAVVNAKPEIKRKAHAEVEKRVKKKIGKISEHKKKTEAEKKKKPTTRSTQRGDDNKGKASTDADGKTIKYINTGFEISSKQEGKKKATEDDDRKAAPMDPAPFKSPFKSPKKKSRRPKVALANFAPPLVDDANDEVSDKPNVGAAPSSSKEPTEAPAPAPAPAVEPKKTHESGDKGKDPPERALSDQDVFDSGNAILDLSEQSESSDEWEAATPSEHSTSPMAPGEKPVDPNLQNKQLVLEFALDLNEGDDGLQVPVKVYSHDDMSSCGVPSIESDDSSDTRMNKMMQRWVDLQGDEEESEDGEDRTFYNNDVVLDDNVLDHIVLAAPDLELAMQQFEDMTGIKPSPVGPLQGLGACTAHVGLVWQLSSIII